jgi:predicted DNA binding CopG/RHH family protein
MDKKQRVTLHLDPETTKELKKQALDAGLNMSEYVAALVQEKAVKR